MVHTDGLGLIIHLINAIRIVALAIIVDVNPDWLYFNHNYTFNIIVYSFVFILWYIWAKKYAGPYYSKTKSDTGCGTLSALQL